MSLRHLLPLLTMLSECKPNGPHLLQNKGSDTMVNLAQAWAEAYRADGGAGVAVSGGGSGTGIAALIAGQVDIANTSRPLRQSELDAAARETGKAPQTFVVAEDAIVIIVHPENPVKGLAIAELACIFAEGGRCERWSDLLPSGVPRCTSDRIIRVSRQSNSGTHQYFRESIAPQLDLRPGALELSGSREGVDLIAHTPCAIGYTGKGYVDATVKSLCVMKDAHTACVAPEDATIRDKSYPLARELFMTTLGPPSPIAQRYLQWLRSPAAREVVRQLGYVPLRGEP